VVTTRIVSWLTEVETNDRQAALASWLIEVDYEGYDWLYIGRESDDSQQYVTGFRFVGLNVAPGSTILTAHLRLYVREADEAICCQINGKAGVAEAGFCPGTYMPADETDLTTANVTLSNAVQDDPGWLVSPDLKTIIQEIVDDPGWTLTSALLLVVTGHMTGYGKQKVQAGPHENGAQLVISWQP
jgi:hypothetical protein